MSGGRALRGVEGPSAFRKRVFDYTCETRKLVREILPRPVARPDGQLEGFAYPQGQGANNLFIYLAAAAACVAGHNVSVAIVGRPTPVLAGRM
jgi:hypothetical protein